MGARAWRAPTLLAIAPTRASEASPRSARGRARLASTFPPLSTVATLAWDDQRTRGGRRRQPRPLQALQSRHAPGNATAGIGWTAVVGAGRALRC